MYTKSLCFLILSIAFIPQAFAQQSVVKIMSDTVRFTVKVSDGYEPGAEIILTDPNTKEKGTAEILECKVKTCLAILKDSSREFPLDRDTLVKLPKIKRKYAVAASIDNALGLTYGVAGYYNFPRKPWMVGFKFRNIDNSVSGIKLSGQIFSLEAQRFLWNKYRFQFWGTSEVGIMNINMDLKNINANEPDISEREYFVTLGLEGRINITDRLRLIAGGSLLYNTMNKTYQGDNGSYNLSTENFYTSVKVGLAYFF